MKVIIVALAFVAVAAAAAYEDELSEISDYKQTPEGGYIFGFKTSGGIRRQEEGELKTVQNEENKPQDVLVVKGKYSYTDPEGNIENVKYYADETGFHVEGPSIPKTASRR